MAYNGRSGESIIIDMKQPVKGKERDMEPKRIAALLSMSILLILPAAEGAFAQESPRWKGSGGWGAKTPYTRMFDPKTIETVAGKVTAVDRIMPRQGMSPGVHLVIETDAGPIPVHLGPEWFLENQDIGFEPGDRVEVTGSKVEFQGKPAVIASEVRKGDEVLWLRDENGFPVWSGWRRR
jgi:hypothetical protein